MSSSSSTRGTSTTRTSRRCGASTSQSPLLRRAGLPVTLVRTGWNHVDMAGGTISISASGVRELGVRAARRVSGSCSPSRTRSSSREDRTRSTTSGSRRNCPSSCVRKASRPPATNIGRYLEDGRNSLLLERGDALEISTRCGGPTATPRSRERLGENGKAFALQKLRWGKNVEPIVELYDEAHAKRSRSAEPRRPVSPLQDRTAREDPRLLPAAVPPDSRERRVVGRGIHRVDERARRRSRCSAATTSRRIPGDLGFYDLRVPDVPRRAGRAGARVRHRRLLLLLLLVRRPAPARAAARRRCSRAASRDFPFCLCWANENWTRRWDGLEDDVLLRAGAIERGWAERFIRDIVPASRRPALHPRRRRAAAPRLPGGPNAGHPRGGRALAHDRRRPSSGTDLHLAAVQSFGVDDPRAYGFDAAVEFPPHTEQVSRRTKRVSTAYIPEFRGYLEDYGAVFATSSRDRPARLPLVSRRDAVLGQHGAPRGAMRTSSWLDPDGVRAWLRKSILQTLCAPRPATSRSCSSTPGTSGPKGRTSSPTTTMGARGWRRRGEHCAMAFVSTMPLRATFSPRTMPRST